MLSAVKINSEYGRVRFPLDDLKPLSDFYSFRNVSLQITKAAILPLNTIALDYDRHLSKFDPEKDDELPPYDWDAALSRAWESFSKLAVRGFSTSLIRKLFEEYSLKNWSIKLTDQLSKDVQKSLVRKLRKYSRAGACQRIFSTSIFSNALTYLSFVIYDSGLDFWNHFLKSYKAACSNKGVVNSILAFDLPLLLFKFSKKLALQSLSLVSQAAGFAAGSYLETNYGGIAGSLIFELTANFLFVALIPMDDKEEK